MAGVLSNKKAHLNYEFLETFEAGLELLGTEVKALRAGLGKLDGSHVIVRGGEAFLVGASIPAYQAANAPKTYDAERPRKLLLTQKELRTVSVEEEKKGLTIVPISVYTKNRKLKLQIAIARGKKKFDKREDLKKKDAKREIERSLKIK